MGQPISVGGWEKANPHFQIQNAVMHSENHATFQVAEPELLISLEL